MSDEIPEDVRRDAIAALDAYRKSTGVSLLVSFEDQVGALGLAILAERERCAKIADDEYEAMKRLDMGHMKIYATKSAEICGAKARTAESIAQAIRSSHD